MTSRWMAFLEVWYTAGWIALVTGALRSVHYVLYRALSDEMLWRGHDTVWMSPVAHMLVFAAPALPLSLLAAAFPARVTPRVTVSFFLTFGLFSILLLFPRLHHLASFALALGIGIQLGGRLAGQWDQVRVVRRWSSLAVLGATVVAATGMLYAESRTERRALAALPAPAAGAPNVLLIILDAVRAQSMQVYGYAGENTPELSRFASEGAVFENAMATAPWTLPMHATLLSGRYPTTLPTDWLVPLDDSTRLIQEYLRERGYVTGGFTANLGYTSRESGLTRGFIRYVDFRRTLTETLLAAPLLQSDLVRDLRNAARNRSPGGMLAAIARFQWSSSDRYQAHHRKPADIIVNQFLDWDGTRQGRPWFAMLNFYDAHLPYKPQAPFDTMFVEPGHGGYEGAIATIDRELGRLFETLQSRGMLDSTIVIVTSDHGEMFGKHGIIEHGSHLYLKLIRIPLIVRYPARVPAGVRVAPTVSVRDMAATILDLTGAPDPRAFPGHSLAETWDGSGTTNRSPAVAAVGLSAPRRRDAPMYWRYVSIVTDSLHYIENGDGVPFLFDYRVDPEEDRNIAGTERGRQAIPALATEMHHTLFGRPPTERRTPP
jgi:arylsulfatase A-like enzyme